MTWVRRIEDIRVKASDKPLAFRGIYLARYRRHSKPNFYFTICLKRRKMLPPLWQLIYCFSATKRCLKFNFDWDKTFKKTVYLHNETVDTFCV